MTLNFFTVNCRVAMSPAFQNFMQDNTAFSNSTDYRVEQGEHGLHLALDRAGFKWNSFIQPDQVHTSEPLVYEAAELVSLRCPIVYKDIFTLNPLTVDMQAVDCRAALEAIQQSDFDFDANMVWESILPYHPLRFIQSNMDDLRIFESKPPEVTREEMGFWRENRSRRPYLLRRRAARICRPGRKYSRRLRFLRFYLIAATQRSVSKKD